MKTHRVKTQKEPTIALINVVFLMLIFFLIAGTVAPQLDPDLALVNTADLDLSAPPDGLVVFPDGALSANGQAVSDVTAYLAGRNVDQRATVRVIPDENLPAKTLLEIAAALRAADVESVVIATERAAQ
ncbi:ExbD/TolR family protein [Loktanella agnita]|uniref:ExbD/TolR family protein n=1 Tax=Loktanella agnita TaxID=287097 RepID=UPI00398761F4